LLPAAALSGALPPPRVAGEQDKFLTVGRFPFETLLRRLLLAVRSRVPSSKAAGYWESIETHATTLPPGAMPHPPHRHVYSEMFCMREGRWS